MAELAAQTALFHAAEGALRRGRDWIIDADNSSLQSLCHLPGHRQIIGEHISRQAVAGVVGGPDNVVELAEVQERHDRGKRLVDQHLRFRMEVGQYSWFEKVAALEAVAP